MIEFSCPNCGQPMRVHDMAAGKTGQCKDCGAPVIVPVPNNLPGLAPVLYQQPIAAPPPMTATPFPQWNDEPAQTTQVVTVNVARESGTAHSLGIASMVLGIVSLIAIWVPIFGLMVAPLGALGLLLGIIGFIVACVRKGAGVGYSIAGIAVSLLALFIGYTVNYVLFFGAVEQVRAAKQRSDESTKKRANNKNAADRPDAKEKAPGNKADGLQGKAPWALAGMIAEDDTIRVEVASVTVGKVRVKDFRAESNSEDELLQIKLRITNKSETKKLNYRSWSASHGGFIGAGSLQDDLDNSYKRISFGFNDDVVGQLRSESIYPSKSVVDLLVFEVSIDKATFLKLELPARAFGGSDEDDLRLKIPMSSIIANGVVRPLGKDNALLAGRWKATTTSDVFQLGTRLDELTIDVVTSRALSQGKGTLAWDQDRKSWVGSFAVVFSDDQRRQVRDSRVELIVLEDDKLNFVADEITWDSKGRETSRVPRVMRLERVK